MPPKKGTSKFKRGQIWNIDLSPTRGHEIRTGVKDNTRPCLILSPSNVNKIGMVFIAPITQGASDIASEEGFLVTLSGAGTKTAGKIVLNQSRFLDIKDRVSSSSPVEKVDDYIVEECLGKLNAILDLELEEED
ncbi:type II toxin-antitoxin system PemK/MazF family toxin [Pectobacterium cacticida]|uniref:Type II toxin-antitoxin system PemK/MazF family toxin n=1 Tax=Pectobacterium cacticida TaxID=69221 RepID=A0ABZ2G9D1_9GAMM|nr:type II toxin-antitoxin system PemK/MazF family toxin [Pectobacterium cacticida]UYX07621.1 type II toxin-antitoxin system PemK/MazF family toxin [Pectobacterium cacticida]